MRVMSKHALGNLSIKGQMCVGTGGLHKEDLGSTGERLSNNLQEEQVQIQAAIECVSGRSRIPKSMGLLDRGPTSQRLTLMAAMLLQL